MLASRHPSPLPPSLQVATVGSPLPPDSVKACEGSPLPPDPDAIAAGSLRRAGRDSRG
jgi:hypothetical protein